MRFSSPVGLWLVLLVLAALTAYRVEVWQSNVTLWADAVATAPCAPRVRVQLALAYAEAGQPEASAAAWQDVLRLVRDGSCERP